MTVLNAAGSAPCLLVCEHASNHIPEQYHGLGLAAADRERHIAWDIGAAALARGLASLLDAPLVLCGTSRLVIDCNRPPGAPSSIPGRSEDTDIPGNHALTRAEAARREALYFAPFQARVAAILDGRAAAGRPGSVIGVHSFTPVFRGVARPWHAGVLHAGAAAFGARLIAGLRADPALVIGDNEPYRIELAEDYTVPVHGDARGIPAALIEVRQDLLADAAAIASWAARLAAIIAAAVDEAVAMGNGAIPRLQSPP